MLRVALFLAVCLLIIPDRPAPEPEKFIVGEPPIPAAPVTADAIPTAERFEELAKTDVLACFRAAVARYRRDVAIGYTATMRKHERINGRMHAPETIEVTNRNSPHSVFMKWISEPAGQADRVLYVEGANDNQMLARPKSALARAVAGSAVVCDPYGRDAKGGGLVAVPDSGLLKAVEQILNAWGKAKDDGRLHAEYLGIKEVKELDSRRCYMFRRVVDPPETDGLKTVEIGLDVETWLQVVNILTDTKGKPIASYYFKDIKLVNEFPVGTFEKAALTK